MAMSKKDFEAIAKAISASRYSADPSILGEPVFANGVNTACAELAGKLATYCATQNPRFDLVRFLRACGVA